ncbi:hypothetical protein [Streptomyces sp. NPDC051997]|uniref:hypothetical protein n=1 Tax=Streptomyces sp. NPDC051997 TaxID=3155611 RepID=UPI00342717DE
MTSVPDRTRNLFPGGSALPFPAALPLPGFRSPAAEISGQDVMVIVVVLAAVTNHWDVVAALVGLLGGSAACCRK